MTKIKKHIKTKCNKIGVYGVIGETDISEWQCPKCKRIFQCGNGYTKKMHCIGD